MLQFFEKQGQLKNFRLGFGYQEDKIIISVTGENHEEGTPEALDRIAELEEYLNRNAIRFETYKRKWYIGEKKTYKTDAIILQVS